MQVSIARQLGLQPTTVGNFFMNARRRLHDKWQNCDYDNAGAKFTENNNENSMATAATAAASGIMIVDSSFAASGTGNSAADLNQQPHDLSFALEAIESIEQPPPPVVQDGCSDNGNGTNVSDHTNSSCVYSLTSL